MHELLQHKMTRCTKHQSRRYTGAETRVEGSKVGLLREAVHLLLTIQKQNRGKGVMRCIDGQPHKKDHENEC